MCWINPNQKCLQKILWRDDPGKPIDTYELSTVTYGTASASYLAIRALYQLGLDCEDPNIVNIIKNHFYVDDLLTGADTVEEATYIIKQVSRVLSSAGFILRKWISNKQEIFKSDP